MRELRQHASRVLARVKAGESIEVTDRGRVVAHLTPPRPSTWDRLHEAGQLRPGTQELPAPVVTEATGRSLSDALADLRDDTR